MYLPLYPPNKIVLYRNRAFWLPEDGGNVHVEVTDMAAVCCPASSRQSLSSSAWHTNGNPEVEGGRQQSCVDADE